MKKYIAILCTVIAALCVVMPGYARKKANDSGEAGIKFEEYVYDFGKISASQRSVSHDFEFMNTGNGNLVIIDANAQCGCTVPEYPKAPIAPAKKGKVRVTFRTAGYHGNFSKDITVKSNGKPRKVMLKIKGEVVD